MAPIQRVHRDVTMNKKRDFLCACLCETGVWLPFSGQVTSSCDIFARKSSKRFIVGNMSSEEKLTQYLEFATIGGIFCLSYLMYRNNFYTRETISDMSDFGGPLNIWEFPSPSQLIQVRFPRALFCLERGAGQGSSRWFASSRQLIYLWLLKEAQQVLQEDDYAQLLIIHQRLSLSLSLVSISETDR